MKLANQSKSSATIAVIAHLHRRLLQKISLNYAQTTCKIYNSNCDLFICFDFYLLDKYTKTRFSMFFQCFNDAAAMTLDRCMFTTVITFNYVLRWAFSYYLLMLSKRSKNSIKIHQNLLIEYILKR